MSRNRRKYTDRDKAAALAMLDANEGNCYKTAKALNIPRATLMEWMDGRVSEDVPEFRHLKNQSLADMCEELARKQWLRLADDDKLDAARYSELNAGFGTCIDKMQLLRQLPTQIIDFGRLTDEQLDRLAAGENPQHVLSNTDRSGAGETPPLTSERVN